MFKVDDLKDHLRGSARERVVIGRKKEDRCILFVMLMLMLMLGPLSNEIIIVFARLPTGLKYFKLTGQIFQPRQWRLYKNHSHPITEYPDNLFFPLFCFTSFSLIFNGHFDHIEISSNSFTPCYRDATQRQHHFPLNHVPFLPN